MANRNRGLVYDDDYYDDYDEYDEYGSVGSYDYHYSPDDKSYLKDSTSSSNLKLSTFVEDGGELDHDNVMAELKADPYVDLSNFDTNDVKKVIRENNYDVDAIKNVIAVMNIQKNEEPETADMFEMEGIENEDDGNGVGMEKTPYSPSNLAKNLNQREVTPTKVETGPLRPEYPDTDIKPFKFNEPSPDDKILEAQSKAFTKVKDTPKNQPFKGRAKYAELKKKEEKKSTSPNTSKRTKPPQMVSKRKTKYLDIIKTEVENEEKKDHYNLVVIGHVDAGKSTLMGHLLYAQGTVDQKMIHKYTKDSLTAGKGSFKYAWVMDLHSDEREAGVTIDVSVRTIETSRKLVTILDAPGHRDFIPNMINGAAQADVAILTICADESNFVKNIQGQAKEHILLARSIGISRIIVAVNKMDLVDWSEERYDTIVGVLTEFLKESGYSEKRVTYIPVSGFVGENLVTKSEHLDWYKGPCLLEALDAVPKFPYPYEKPFRFIISDVYKDDTNLGLTVAGKIQSGFVTKGDKILNLPLDEVCQVKAIRFQNEMTTYAFAGQNVEIGLTNVEEVALNEGNVLCDPESPVRVCREFRAQIVVMGENEVITKGQQVVFHRQNTNNPAVIKHLLHTLDKNNELKKKKPKFITEKESALVVIALETPICVELGTKYLSRFSLRCDGNTIAAGIVKTIKK